MSMLGKGSIVWLGGDTLRVFRIKEGNSDRTHLNYFDYTTNLKENQGKNYL
jgi:hypothetical protein